MSAVEIKPGIGVGTLRFGMSITEARQAMGVMNPETVDKCGPGEPPTDFFFGCVFAYYDTASRLQAVECWLPVRPTLDGVDLLGMSARMAMDLLSSRDTSFEYELGGATAPNLGVGLYVPHPGTESREPAETVIVFVKGYYD